MCPQTSHSPSLGLFICNKGLLAPTSYSTNRLILKAHFSEGRMEVFHLGPADSGPRALGTGLSPDTMLCALTPQELGVPDLGRGFSPTLLCAAAHSYSQVPACGRWDSGGASILPDLQKNNVHQVTAATSQPHPEGPQRAPQPPLGNRPKGRL